MEKKYVEVEARFHADGAITPVCIIWDDGSRFEIDRVLDVRRAAALKVGGIGLRYTVLIGGREKHLWYEEPKWFVAAKGENS